jgi:hypothetical protein
VRRVHCFHGDADFFAKVINKEIGATKSWNGQMTVPCEKISELPPMSFVFAGKEFQIEASDYILNIQGLVDLFFSWTC